MKKVFTQIWLAVLGCLAIALVSLLVVMLVSPAMRVQAQVVGEQVLLRMSFITDGISARGERVLQTGEVSTLSAAIASGTLTQVVAVPPAGASIYLRGLWVEKAATSTGSILVRYGTGTNCGTETTTLLALTAASSQTFQFGYYPVGVQVPAAKALCLATEGANTGVRALTN